MSELEVKRIKNLLDSKNIEYKLFEHEAVFTSEQASKVRGVDLKTGVKALVLKTKEGKLILALVAADRRIDLKKLAKKVNTKDLRLASPEEVLKKTGCKIGSVHPFGILHSLETYMDASVLENEKVNFNVGIHEKSIEMKSEDLVKVVNPVECEISD